MNPLKRNSTGQPNPMKIIYLLALTLCISPILAQNIGQLTINQQPFSVFSAGGMASVDASSTPKFRIYGAFGQLAAASSTPLTQTQAGFMQVSGLVESDLVAPVITYASPLTVILSNGSNVISPTIVDNIEVNIDSAKIHYRPITSATWQSAVMTPGGNAYSISVASSWWDNMGMEYYLTARDWTGNPTRSPATGSYYAYLTSPTYPFPLPTGSDGLAKTNWRIIAMPFDYGAATVDQVLHTGTAGLPQMPPHDDASQPWRLVKYDLSTQKRKEYPGDFQTFERRQGYYFITRDEATITLTNANAPSENRLKLDSINLKNGWNMIGNPYPVPINWSDVKAYNNDPNIGEFDVYDGGWNFLGPSDALPPFTGGFVNYSGAGTKIKIPFQGQTLPGGRAVGVDLTSDISADSWRVRLALFQGDTFNKLAGFGMDPTGKTGPDPLDGYNPPKFIDDPEVNFSHPELPLFNPCTDIVATQPEYIWAFTPIGDTGQPMSLQWGDDLGSGAQELYLYDESLVALTNMREKQEYQFTLASNHKFKLYFGNNVLSRIAPATISLAPPYPNPVYHETTTFNLGLPDNGQPFQVGIKIFNGTGIQIRSDLKTLPSGVHQLSWLADDSLGNGIYLYQISVSSANQNQSFTGKIIVQQ